MSFELGSFLAMERQRVDTALAGVAAVANASGPVGDAVRYAVASEGKRLRPILCIAAYRAVRGDVPESAYTLAASLELIHAYSLVHDDLPSMDDDPIRRGRASTHVAHGVAPATLAGAALIPIAVGVLSRGAVELGVDAAERAELVRLLCAAAGGGGMIGGQLLDLEAEGRPMDLDALTRIHRLKTGALLAAAPVLGGRAAGGASLILDALTAYGHAVGLAFQIADDILDVTGSTEVLGKTAGRDSVLDKATFPGLLGVERARSLAAEQSAAAVAALAAVGIRSEELDALARYAVERDR